MIIIAGPCQIEKRSFMEGIASHLYSTFNNVMEEKDEFYFKSSFDKANRTNLKGKRGPGFDKGLEILFKLKNKFGFKIITDVHDIWQCGPAAEVVDVLQIPAFLCRQTDLLREAAEQIDLWGVKVNVKKGQWMAPWDVAGILSKTGTKNVWITERGTMYGYNRLVVDFTGIQYMRNNYTVPIILDATHAVQQPGGLGESSGGNRDYAPGLVRAATAQGIDGVFMEVHPTPDTAPSDGPNMLNYEMFDSTLKSIRKIVDSDL